MDDEDLVGTGELHDPLEEPSRHDRAGRVVRIVEVHELRPPRDALLDRAEVRDEPVLGLERHQHRLGSGQPGAARIDGVAGICCERIVAGIQEREVEIEDRLLGADRGDDLRVGIERYVEAARVEVAHRGAEVRAAAVGRVPVRFRLADGLLHRLDDQRRRRPVGVADAEADHVDSRRALLGDLALQLRERIRRDALQALTRFHAAPW